MSKNYFISRDNKNGEVVYLEYNKDGYNVKPSLLYSKYTTSPFLLSLLIK